MKFPLSNRVVDFDLKQVRSAAECSEALRWLRDRLADMEGQIEYREATDGELDPEWLARVQLAMKKTRIRIRWAEERLRALDRPEIAQAFLHAAESLFDREDLSDVWEEVWRSHPELKGREWHD